MNKRSLLAALFFGLGFFAIFAFVMPQYSKWQALRELRDLGQSTLEQRQQTQSNIGALSAQINSHQDDVSKVASFLPPTKQADEIISSVNDVATQSGLQIQTMDINDAASNPSDNALDYKKIMIDVSLVGNYQSFDNFLKNVEENIRPYDVTEINASNTKANSKQLKFQVKFTTYALK